MSAPTVACPHCSQVCRIDFDRLPDGPSGVACPGCKGEMMVDPGQFRGTAGAADANTKKTGDRRFIRLPAGATIPSGIILGEDDAGIREIQDGLVALGSEVERVESAEVAREMIVTEQVGLCIYVHGSVTAPPFAPMAPLTGLTPSFRRRLYLVLVADNLKTLDGTAAFIYQVNMTLARRDLPHLAAALYTGFEYHERLYRPYLRAAAI